MQLTGQRGIRRPDFPLPFSGEFAMFRAVFLVLAAVVSTMTAQGTEARTLDQVIKSGTIRIGVNPNFPPMSSYKATNHGAGLRIYIGNKIASTLNIKDEFLPDGAD